LGKAQTTLEAGRACTTESFSRNTLHKKRIRREAEKKLFKRFSKQKQREAHKMFIVAAAANN